MKTPPNSFLKACGAIGPLCIQIANRTTRRLTYQMLDQPFVVIGRDKHADIVLDDPDVGWRRAYVQVIDGHLFAMDLRAPIIGAERKDPTMPCWLSPARSLAFGPFDVTVTIGDRSAPQAQTGPGLDDNPLSSRYGERDPLHNITLIFQNKVKRDLVWPMDRVLTILGQSPECKIHLKSSSVSNYHCSLVRTRQGVWVLDLLGRGGISINGSSVRCARFADGDVLKVGDFLIEMRCSLPGAGPRLSSQLPAIREPHAVPSRRGERRTAITKAPAVSSGSAASSGELSASQLSGDKSPQPGPAQPPGSWSTEVLGPVDPASKALFEQFGMMQQQMVEQFDRVVSMMCQMFTALHREQSTQVRDELEQIRRLTQELTVLKAEQVALSAGQGPPSPSDPAILTMPLREETESPWTRPQAQEAGAGEPREQAGAVAFDPTMLTEPEPAVESSSGSTLQGVQASGPGEPAPDRERTTAQASNDIHLRLSRRIAEIQQEQRGRLQRLLGLVTGR